MTHTNTHTHTTALDEGSSHREELYLKTYNIHTRWTSMTPEGFEPAIPASKGPQTHTLDSAAAGICSLPFTYILTVFYGVWRDGKKDIGPAASRPLS
jgi:hypothetical protein